MGLSLIAKMRAAPLTPPRSFAGSPMTTATAGSTPTTALRAGDESFDFWRVEGVTLDGSTRDRAYPIYNIWHLQAMDGYALPPEVAASISVAAMAAGVDIENEITAAREFFDPPAKALTASYQLARSFDAGATREWNAGAGFTAIGGGDGGSFTGALYGVDFVIDGLFTRAPIGGLFARLGAGALVERVGLEGVDMEISLRAIERAQPLGAFAAYLTGATIAQSWARGRVVGEDSIGGLIGSATAGAAEISLSWFAGDVEARGDAVGGVAGYVGSDDAVIVDSWAVARGHRRRGGGRLGGRRRRHGAQKLGGRRGRCAHDGVRRLGWAIAFP